MDWSRFREALRQGCVDPFEACIKQGGKGGSPPPAPDYRAAAQETATGNLEATRAATAANRYNQYTPYGQQTWQQLGPDQWQSNINLEPIAQQTLNTQMQLSNQMGDLTKGQIPGVQQQYSQPMDLSSVGDIENKAYQAQTSRLDPQWTDREAGLRTQLANQGLVAGGEAYDKEMRNFGQQRNDAYQQARLGAISTMPQTYQLASAAYQQPLNQLNALRTGAQIQNPTFNQPGMQQTAGGPNYLGAAQSEGQYAGNLYSNQIAQQNAMTSGLFGLGQAGLGAYGSYAGLAAMSDRRLKSNIKRIGTHPLGIGVYEYDIFGHREIGVMADEVEKVKPEAVIELPSGYLAVNYGML